MESSGGFSTPTQLHQDAELPYRPRSTSSAASSVTAVDQTSSQTWDPDAPSSSTGTALNGQASQQRDFTIIPPGWPHASSGWAPEPLTSGPVSLPTAAPYPGRHRMPSYNSTSSWPGQAHSSQAARQQAALGQTREDESPAQGTHFPVSEDDSRARSSTPGDIPADTPTAPGLPGKSQLYDTAGDQDTFETSNVSGAESARHLGALRAQLWQQEEPGHREHDPYRAARNEYLLSAKIASPRQTKYQPKAPENFLAPDSPRSALSEADGEDQLSMPTEEKREDEEKEEENKNNNKKKKRDSVAREKTPGPSSPQRLRALVAQCDANIRAYEHQLHREQPPTSRPQLGLAITALKARLGQLEVRLAESERKQEGGPEQQPHFQSRPLRGPSPPGLDNPEIPSASGSSPVPAVMVRLAPVLRRRRRSDGLNSAFQRQGGQPDNYDNQPATENLIEPEDTSQVSSNKEAKVEPEPREPVKQPAANSREAAGLLGSTAAGDEDEQDHDDVEFEEIELPKPQESLLREEAWDYLDSEHAPKAASQNSSYPGPGPGFVSRFLGSRR